MRHLYIGMLASLLLLLAACTASKSLPLTNGQGACDQRADYHIHFRRFDEMAQQLTHATGCFIHVDLEHDGDVEVNPVQGHFSIREALQRAIQGTRLHIVDQGADMMTVE